MRHDDGREAPGHATPQPAEDRGAADPFSGSSLVPMLVAGLVLVVIGMIAAVALS
jgi:hypothetical protein